MLKQIMRGIIGIGLASLCNSASSAPGWTDFGPISTLEQNPANAGSISNQIMVVVSVTTNPSSCANPNGFYFTATDDRQSDYSRC
jgi:hypothetical protein